MDAFSLAFTSGWASGLNAYATVLVLGLVGRFAEIDQIPGALQRADVLIAAGVLCALEVVVDKIPYVDSIWDTISTLSRPTIGTVIGALIAGTGDTSLNAAFLAAIGGASALITHAVKASLRLALNTSPEPVTNFTASSVEDVAASGTVALATANPVVAAIIAAVLLIIGLFVAIKALRLVRRGLGRFGQFIDKVLARAGSPPAATPPADPAG